ncbi:hypothetical protein [Ferrovibrio sp.]|uniref:hypothetical protein n=1 Tax=Ferrovibrio sp. TaxID=1917215 RepID=UPI001B64423C|nr:hypothetical protein [Ferrovibrio sp.]MBP7064672.1 hypothetical protein [Ferrovibrio sp.]
MSWVRAFHLGLLLLVAACQPLPQPFLPDEKGLPIALTMPTGEHSLYVLPVANAEGELAQSLAAGLAAALVERDWPASALARSSASSDLVTALAEDEQGRVIWVWQLSRFGGPPLNGSDLPLGLDAETLAAAPEATRQALARAMAQRVANEIEQVDASQRAEAALDPSLPKLFLRPFQGAPGDGNTALARAFGDQIIGLGLARPVRDAAQADYQVECVVALSDAGPRAQQVALAWSLYAPSGERLGSITQANRVPRGSLDGAWGGIAQAAAQGGAEGLRDMLARLKAAPKQ